MVSKKLVYARIRCINRTTKKLFDRDFWLDLSTLPENEQKNIEKLTRQRVNPVDFWQIRSLFNEGQRIRIVNNIDFDLIYGFAVNDYFEDEAGNPLDEIGLAQILSGQDYPILPHHVGSVLRLGPTGICRKELWTIESANALAHFFQLVEVIGTSEWLKSKLSISTPSTFEAPPWINSFECPDLGQIYSILLPIRQLYAADDAFNHACKVYMRHVTEDRKRCWIEQIKKEFNSYLESVPHPFALENYTVRQVLDLVMYGAGMVHYAKSKPETRHHFKEAVTRHRREMVVFVFISYCQEVYQYAANAYFVLLQDYKHWLESEGCQAPDLVFLKRLFSSTCLLTNELTCQ